MPSKIIAIYVVPLIPTLILFLLFENAAEVHYAAENATVRLTGSAGFYAILLYFSMKHTGQLFDPLHKIRKMIVGKWSYETTGYDKKQGEGFAQISIDGDSLTITGELTLAGHDDPGKVRKFAWDATEVFLSKEKITWFFNFPGMQREGVARMNLHPEGKQGINSMLGEWGVAGQALGGEIRMTRI